MDRGSDRAQELRQENDFGRLKPEDEHRVDLGVPRRVRGCRSRRGRASCGGRAAAAAEVDPLAAAELLARPPNVEQAHPWIRPAAPRRWPLAWRQLAGGEIRDASRQREQTRDSFAF
ncbi:hypothetical protein GQ55_9G138500 [Panicum hallii var. hallii]|uniref:Uncharacterized protein n=1 Tax=Panicum hallii var. hallii TaxID=1504633 RepID=A0A2T7C2X6_9POAL|nr:hypothetical protein GQ55_9G138500 [Panicum hallii var. hallii]